jgi:hypothetical protein
VADKLGKPPYYVSKVDSEERRINPVELQRFATVYGITVAHLIP